jgi:hypothetical protein
MSESRNSRSIKTRKMVSTTKTITNTDKTTIKKILGPDNKVKIIK